MPVFLFCLDGSGVQGLGAEGASLARDSWSGVGSLESEEESGGIFYMRLRRAWRVRYCVMRTGPADWGLTQDFSTRLSLY